jgi:hypothetical protein
VHGTIHLPRQITQVVLVVGLISAMALVGLVVSSAPARAVSAQDVHSVLNLAGAFVTKLSTLASSATAVTRYGPCGASMGPC